MSDFASDSDNDGDDRVAMEQATEDYDRVRRLYTQTLGEFGGGAEAFIATLVRGGTRVQRAIAVLEYMLDRMNERRPDEVEFAKNLLLDASMKNLPMDRVVDANAYLGDPDEYHKAKAEKTQEAADLPVLLRHMFVHSGAARAPADVLERYFARCAAKTERRHEWSEYFAPGPDHGVSAREREAHIVAARVHDEARRGTAKLSIVAEMVQSTRGVLPSVVCGIVFDYVPYARNLVLCEGVAAPAVAGATAAVGKVCPVKLVELDNSHNMGNPGKVLVLKDGNKPVKLPTDRFLARILQMDKHVVWVSEHNGCTMTWTWRAPGVMFGLNTVTGVVENTLPCYDDDGPEDGYRNAEREICPPGGGQMFLHATHRESFSHVHYTNLDMPFGVYFSDSFGPPRFQHPVSHWKKIDEETVTFVADGTTHRLAYTFGTPLDMPPPSPPRKSRAELEAEEDEETDDEDAMKEVAEKFKEIIEASRATMAVLIPAETLGHGDHPRPAKRAKVLPSTSGAATADTD